MTATKFCPGGRSRPLGSTAGAGRQALRLLALVSLPVAAAQGPFVPQKEGYDSMMRAEKAPKGVAGFDLPFGRPQGRPPQSFEQFLEAEEGLRPPQPRPAGPGGLGREFLPPSPALLEQLPGGAGAPDVGDKEVYEDLMNALADLPEAEKLMKGDKAKAGGPGLPALPNKVRGLFPGPLLLEEETGTPKPPMPFNEPDPLVMDMLQDMDHTVQDVLMPAIHGLANSIAPMSCDADLKKHCLKARSQVHCLGQHSADISPACRDDVGKSVPFICSDEISKFCDVLHMGLLKCLDGHFSQLNPECKDSVAATRQVIKHANKGGMQDLLAAVVEAPEALEQRLDDQLSRLAAEAGLPTSLAQMPNMEPTIAAPRVSLWMVAALLVVAFAGYALTASETVQEAVSKALKLMPATKEGDRKPLLSMVEMPPAV